MDIAQSEGVFNYADLAERVGVHANTLRKPDWLPTKVLAELRKEHRRRCNEARRLYVEMKIDDPAQIAAQANLARTRVSEILAQHIDEWAAARADHQLSNPILFSTGQILYQAAELLLGEIRTKGYNDESINKWVALANGFEKFNTGEFRDEMAISGISDFAIWLRENAKRLKVKPDTVRDIAKLVDEYRKQRVQSVKVAA